MSGAITITVDGNPFRIQPIVLNSIKVRLRPTNLFFHLCCTNNSNTDVCVDDDDDDDADADVDVDDASE